MDTLFHALVENSSEAIHRRQPFRRPAVNAIVVNYRDATALQSQLFEPFFTTNDPSKGTGLGLSIVYGIAKEAGGTVAFSTADRQGTTFEVLLPLTVAI